MFARVRQSRFELAFSVNDDFQIGIN